MRAGTPDRLRPPPFFDFDPVGILSLSDQIGEAYAIADRYRVQGTSVVLGGLDAPVSTRVRGPAVLLCLPGPGDDLDESTRLRQAPSQFSGLGTLVILRFTQCVEYFYSEHKPMQDHRLFGRLPAWLDLPMNNAVDPVSELRPMGSGPAIPVHPATLGRPGPNRQHEHRLVRCLSQRFNWEERDGVAEEDAASTTDLIESLDQSHAFNWIDAPAGPADGR